MTTAEINAYLDWRAQREGRQVDVSPEAYERDMLISEVFDRIRNAMDDPEMDVVDAWDGLEKIVEEYDELEKEN